MTAQGIAQPPALPPGDGRHPTSCRALWRLSQGRGVPGTGKVLLLWWPGPKRPPGGVLATLLRPRHPAPARRCRGPRRAGHTTFLDPGTRRTSPMASASVSPFGLLHRQSFQEGEGRARERQAPRPLSNVHSRVQGPLLPGQHGSPSQNWGAEPGAWLLPSPSRTLELGVRMPCPRGWTPSPSPLLCLGVPDALTQMGALTLGHLRTGAGPVAAQGWSGAGMFALTICQKGGCPWPLLGSPSPCPGAQAQLSLQLPSSWGGGGILWASGEFQVRLRHKGVLPAPGQSAGPVPAPSVPCAGRPQPSRSSPAQHSPPSGLPSPAQRLCKSLRLLN